MFSPNSQALPYSNVFELCPTQTGVSLLFLHEYHSSFLAVTPSTLLLIISLSSVNSKRSCSTLFYTNDIFFYKLPSWQVLLEGSARCKPRDSISCFSSPYQSYYSKAEGWQWSPAPVIVSTALCGWPQSDSFEVEVLSLPHPVFHHALRQTCGWAELRLLGSVSSPFLLVLSTHFCCNYARPTKQLPVLNPIV